MTALLALLALVGSLNFGECAITAWTKPEISTPSGSGTLIEKINDGVTSATNITITATTATGYNKVSQDPETPVLAIDNSGVVTVSSGTVSYSASTSFTFVVNATDGNDTESATVTINVNAAPAITTHSSTPCIADSSTVGTDLIDLAATDSNSDQEITWDIGSGDTNGDFTISSSGVIEVASGKTLNMTATDSYTLVITAADNSSTPLTATTTVTASVQTTCPSSSVAVAISLMTLLAALGVTKLFLNSKTLTSSF